MLMDVNAHKLDHLVGAAVDWPKPVAAAKRCEMRLAVLSELIANVSLRQSDLAVRRGQT